MTSLTKDEHVTTADRRERSVLLEAQSLVHGARDEAYGHPREDFGRTAEMVTALLRHKLRPTESIDTVDVARIMIAVKLSRTVHASITEQPRRDSWVDIAGYAETAAWCED